MKKIKLIVFLATVGLVLVSCQRNITEPVISSNPVKPTSADLSLTVAFTVNNADSLITFSWSAADFGFSSSTSYAVQLSPKSDFSSNVATLFTTQTLKGTAKVGDINTLILSWNYAIGTPVTVYYRISASVTSSITVYTDAKSKSFTPYDAVINYPMAYVPGAYQGWSPGAENGRLFSYGFNSQYSGIVRIKDGTNAASEFKITNAPDWSHTNWGGTLTKSGNNYSGTLDPSGGNLQVTAGTYAIVVDVSALTITLTKTDDWGVIGSATANGWNSSTPMFYNGQRKMWEITASFAAGEFKFRANDAWDLNYGDNGADGTLEAGGANIALSSAGNYTIRFDPVKLTYTVKKN
ncbi:MAG: SusE domain-containing protein [Ignavibacteriales bacterium]|nr:SusE domain-containing protein [Ignavibacteriales bacterium]